MAAEKPTANATAAQAKPATTSAATRAAAIVPERHPFTWKTPFIWTSDFAKGTIGGTANAIAKGGNRGFKIGMALAVVAFFLPLFPAASAVVAHMLPGLVLDPSAAVATFIPNGIPGLISWLGYGVGGAILGAGFSGAAGLVTGGAREIQLRLRRDKYSEELAERAEMKARAPQQSAGYNWRDYANEYKRKQNKSLERQYYFNNEQAYEKSINNPEPTTKWRDHVDRSRDGHHERGLW
jgi:hypothetical protein